MLNSITMHLPVKRLLDPKIQRALQRALKLSDEEMLSAHALAVQERDDGTRNESSWRLTCTPAQFGEFIALRCTLGGQNLMQELNLVLDFGDGYWSTQARLPVPRACPTDTTRR